LEATFHKCLNQRQVLKYEYSTGDSDLALVKITLYLVDARVLRLRLIPREWDILDVLVAVFSGRKEHSWLAFLTKLNAKVQNSRTTSPQKRRKIFFVRDQLQRES
jgi:hypothetical protein